MNAFTSSEYTCYYTRSLDTKLDSALDVLTDMVRNSQFPDEEIGKEKKVVIEEMKMYRDSPEDYLFESFSSKIFKNHPLGRPIIGYEDTVNSFSRDDLFTYIQERYQPWNMLISVAGNVDHDKVVEWTKEHFTDKGVKNELLPKADLLPDYEKHQEIITKPIEQTHMVIGRIGLHYDHPDKYRMLLANTILGGGMSSRLHQNIREKYGYCYTIGTFNQSYTDSGLFGVYIGTDKDYVEHVRELIKSEFENIQHSPVPDKELFEAKSQLKGKLLLSQENMSNRMTRLAKSELYFNRFVTLDELVEKIDEVTVEDIQKFSVDFFNNDHYSETLLLPEDA